MSYTMNIIIAKNKTDMLECADNHLWINSKEAWGKMYENLKDTIDNMYTIEIVKKEQKEITK